MALRLLAALIALALLHLMPQLAQWRRNDVFRRWVAQLGDLAGSGRVVLALLPVVLLCWLLWHLLGISPLGILLQLLFAVALLLYCFGPREFESDLEAILNASDDVRREAAAQALADDGESVAWQAPALGATIAYAALRRRFGVLCWFFLLGPLGALLYRLAQTMARDESVALDSDSRSAATYVANALDWLPAQLLTFTLAVVGHWDAVMNAWRHWHSQMTATSWYSSGPGFLGAAAQADIVTDVDAGDGYAVEHSDPLHELTRLRRMLLRALLFWLGLVALIVIGGWIR